MATSTIKRQSAATEIYIVNATYGVYAYKSGNVVTVYINYNDINIIENLGTLPEKFRPAYRVDFKNYSKDFAFRINPDGGIYTIGTPDSWASATTTYITNS